MAATVLIIDDEEAIGSMLAEVLQARGYATAVTTRGSEGVKLARTLVPDVVLCDVRMPILGGEEVVLMLRGNPVTAHIPIVMMSGYCEAGYAELADGFLQKPFQFQEVFRSVEEQIAKSHTPVGPAPASLASGA